MCQYHCNTLNTIKDELVNVDHDLILFACLSSLIIVASIKRLHYRTQIVTIHILYSQFRNKNKVATSLWKKKHLLVHNQYSLI
jgi:hypothetical protein